jgi:Histidine kinase-, DNA gyrase B-, and HSP90-like ATPase
VQQTFAVSSVTLLRRDTAAPASVGATTDRQATGGLRATWSCVASVGGDPCLRPEDGDTEVPVGDDLNLVLRGRALAAADQRVLAAFATQVAVAYQQTPTHGGRRGRRAACRGRPDAHRLAERRQPRPAHTHRVSGGGRVQPAQRRRHVPETLPAVVVDPGLLERVIADLVENALRHSTAEQPIRTAASTHGEHVELRVIDNGPGIAPDKRETVFVPFQRRDDHATDSAGVGLGRGGLMAVVTLPIAPEADG